MYGDIMKKTLSLLLVLSFMLLVGCSASGDSDVSKIVDPSQYGSVISGPAPSTFLPPEESGRNQAMQPDTNGASDTIYTVNMQGSLKNGYFIGEEFSFFVHSLWRDHFSMTSSETLSGEFYMRAFYFNYIDEVSGTSATVLRIDVLYSQFADAYGSIGRTELGRSQDDVYVYLHTPINVDLPDDFGARAEFAEIYRSVLSDTLDFRVLV